jgi:hypothetical protein
VIGGEGRKEIEGSDVIGGVRRGGCDGVGVRTNLWM